MPPAEPARPSPLWARALALNALSDPRFVPVAIGGLFTALALRAVLEPFGDQDAGWLAAAGRRMLETGQVPRANGWAVTDADVPWVMHEWALGPLYAWLMQSLGLAGPVLLGLVAALATTTLLALGTLGRTRSLGAGALVAVLAVVGARECLLEPRPAYVLLAAPLVMALLGASERFSRGRALACVALELAWANAHGSFPLGLGVLALGVLSFDTGRPLRIGTLALAGGATALTPYGLALHGLVGRYVGGGDAAAEAIHAHIAEFQPLWAAGPVFGSPVRVGFAALVVLAGALGASRGARADRLAAAAALVLGLLAFVHARHVPQAITLGAVLLAPTVDRWLEGVTLDRPSFVASRVARHVALACALGASLAAATALARGVRADEALGGDVLPSFAHDPRARGRAAYVAFDASGRYLWLAPGARVLFDPRNDCYRAETALGVYALEEGDCTGACVSRTLAPVDVVIVGDDHPALPELTRDFDRARSEGGWNLFVRRGTVLR